MIVEGTYTPLLKVDLKIFMERNYHDTLKNRIERARDPLTPFVESVLEIESEFKTFKAKATRKSTGSADSAEMSKSLRCESRERKIWCWGVLQVKASNGNRPAGEADSSIELNTASQH